MAVLFVLFFASMATFLVVNKDIVIKKFAMKKKDSNLINPMYKIYKLEKNRDLVFELPTVLKNSRLVVRPIFKDGPRDYPLNVNYSINYEIIGRDGTIDSREYNMNTFLAEDKFELAKKRFKYGDGKLVPYGAKVLYFNYRLGLSKAKVRVRLKSGDPEITEFVARLQYSQEIDSSKIDMKWERMPVKRKRLAELNNVYRHELFSEREKFNLTHEAWRTVAPIGRPGVDFIEENFIVDPNIDFFTYVEKFKPEYLLSSFVRIDPTHCMIITSLTDEHPVKFTFQVEEGINESDVKIRMSWYGRKSFENRSEIFKVKNKMKIEKYIEPGVIELCSDSVVLSEARQLFNNKIEVLSQATFRKLMQLDPEDPVRYRIFHSDKNPSPYKFDIYTTDVVDELKLSERAKLKVFDKKSQLIKTIKLKANSMRSKYNRVNDKDALDISEKQENVIFLPRDSHFVELYGATSLMVKAYSRPFKLKTMDRVPRDFYKPLFDKERIPHWYPVKPKNYSNIFNSKREVSIRMQRKPPERKEYIVNHEYESESFEPLNEYIGKYILAESQNINKKLPASSYSFVKLALNEDLEWEFSNSKKEIKISPSIHLVSKELPNLIEVYIDGKSVYKKIALHDKTTIVLPKIFSGDRTLRVETEKASNAWINFSKVRTNLSFKKKIFSLTQGPLIFEFYKRDWGEMNLVGQVYLPKSIKESFKLKGRVRSGYRSRYIAFEDWTLVERQWDILPTERLYPLYNDLGVLKEGGSFSISLFPDMPPGQYIVELELDDSIGAYITLAEIAKKGLIPVKKSIKLEMHE